MALPGIPSGSRIADARICTELHGCSGASRLACIAARAYSAASPRAALEDLGSGRCGAAGPTDAPGRLRCAAWLSVFHSDRSGGAWRGRRSGRRGRRGGSSCRLSAWTTVWRSPRIMTIAQQVGRRQRLERGEQDRASRVPSLAASPREPGSLELELAVAVPIRLLAVGRQEVGEARAQVARHVLHDHRQAVRLGVERHVQLVVARPAPAPPSASRFIFSNWTRTSSSQCAVEVVHRSSLRAGPQSGVLMLTRRCRAELDMPPAAPAPRSFTLSELPAPPAPARRRA